MRKAAKVALLGAAGLGFRAFRRGPHRAPGASRTRDTEAAVRRALADPPIPATTLRASALTPRIVELTGLVSGAAAAREAVRRARSVAGVEVVVDRLESGR